MARAPSFRTLRGGTSRSCFCGGISSMPLPPRGVSIRPRAIRTSTTRPTLDFASINHTPLRLGLGALCMTSREPGVVETASELLNAVLPDTPADEDMGMPSFLHGIEATASSADTARARRHAMCNVDIARLGFKHLSCHCSSQYDAAPSMGLSMKRGSAPRRRDGTG